MWSTLNLESRSMPSLFGDCPNSPNSRGTCAKIAPPLCTHCSNYVSTLSLYPWAAWIQARVERTSNSGMHRPDLLKSRSDLHLFSRCCCSGGKQSSDQDPIFRSRYVYIFSTRRETFRASGRERINVFYFRAANSWLFILSCCIIRQVEPMPNTSPKLARIRTTSLAYTF